MVIFDRMGRDSDCSFINSSSEQNSVQIGEAPLAKLTEIHGPCLVRERSFGNQNAFLQRTKPNPAPPAPAWCSNTNLRFCRCLQNMQRKCLGDTSLWMFCMTHSHDRAMRKNGLFPASPDHKVPLMRCCAKLEVMQRGSGQENAWHHPSPPSSNEIKMVVSCGCLHRRRAHNPTPPPNKKSKLRFMIKCQLASAGEVFVMHRDDNKTIRHFSGQFVYLFVSNILNNLSQRIPCAIGLRK